MATKAALDFTFDDEELEFQEESAKGPQPIPLGWYNVGITDVSLDDYQETSPYKGKKYLTLSIKVLSGDQKGREVRYVRVPLFTRFNPTAKNPQGTATSFHAFFNSLGLIKGNKLVLRDFNRLFGSELQAKISLTQPNDDGRVFNQVQPFAGSWKPKAEEEEGDDSGEITFGEPETSGEFTL